MWKFAIMTSATALAVLTLLIPFHALAEGCFEESPNLSEQKDDYYNLGLKITISENEKTRLAEFLKGIEGSWQGESVDTTCKGTDRSPRTEAKVTAIQANIQPNPAGGLIIAIDKLHNDSTSKRSVLDWLGKTPIFSFSLTENTLEFSEKHRTITNRTQNTRIDGSRIFETLYKIEASNDALTIIISYYSNGYHTGTDRWSMTRK